jgi:transcriptional regulator with XRE-family HTH domain
MSANPLLTTIRTKKLGVLIRDARLAHKKTIDECANALGVSHTSFEAYELGDQAPSLPELELLAYYFGMPLEHFWGNRTAAQSEQVARHFDARQLVGIRQRMIGVLLRKVRSNTQLSLDDLEVRAGIPKVRLEAYEMGAAPIPLPDLEVLVAAMNASLKDFQDHTGPVGSWFGQQRAVRDFLELSQDLQSFVSKPVNRPYLELAQRLSEMSVEKLRAVAEGLLEITL